MQPDPLVRSTAARRNLVHHFLQRFTALPPAVLAIYALTIYVALISAYNLFLSVQVRVTRASLAFPGETNDPLYELGTSLGFWGMIYFCVNFLLATRWRWIERLFDGLDKVYQLHAFVGKTTLTLVVLHMTILIVQALPDAQLIATYVVPGLDVSYTMGLLGVLILTILVIVTIWIKLAYHIWLQTHKVMGLAYVLGGLHAIILQGDWYMIALTTIGGYAWFYNLVLYRRFAPRYAGTLTQNTLKGDVNELVITLDRPMKVQAGQFVFISVQDSVQPVAPETHPFSVSSIIDPRTIRISAKTLGDYTAALRYLAVSDRIMVFGPYGAFGAKHRATRQDMVWIAGGIGITPFLSMLQAETEQAAAPQRTIHVIWTVRKPEDAVYDEELRCLQQQAAHVVYHLHVSSQQGRLTCATIVQLIGEHALQQSAVFMCGPLPMMHMLTEQLLDYGKQRRAIITEEFALRS